MPVIPLRLTLCAGLEPSAKRFAFTISVAFASRPAAGDQFILFGRIFVVSHNLHFLEGDEPAVLAVVSAQHCDGLPSFYALIDQFRATYSIADVVASEDEPDFYYIVWRVVSKVLGLDSPELPRDAETVKLFAETCRAALLVASGHTHTSPLPTDEVALNIHSLVAERGGQTFDALGVLAAVPQPESPQRMDAREVARVAFKLLEKYRTIQTDRLGPIYAAINSDERADDSSGL